MVVKSFKRIPPEDLGSSNENNNFSKMKSIKQWNYGDGQRGILPTTKNGIISYKNEDHYSFDYACAYHSQTRLLRNNHLTKTIDFSRNWIRWWRIYIIGFVSIVLALKAPTNKQGIHVGTL